MALGTSSIPVGSLYGFSQTVHQFDSNATLTDGDLVTVQSGQLELAEGAELIAGVIMQDATSASTGVDVNITPGQEVIMDNNNDVLTFAATDIGNRFNITGATGAQVVNTQSREAGTVTTPSNQLLTVAYNPQGYRQDLDSDTSIGLFRIAKTQF